MIYEREALQNIFNEYEEDRTRARVMRDKRVKEITEKYPHLLEIQQKITELGIENFKKILDNPKKSESYNEKFKKELSKLEAEKEEFLLQNGIEKDFDEVKYKCEKCLDTGYINNEKCPCLVQKIIDLHYEMSNMKNILHDFSEFSFDYYGDGNIESLGMTEKDFCEKAGIQIFRYGFGSESGKPKISSAESRASSSAAAEGKNNPR